MMTKFEEIPESLQKYTNANLENEDFADDVNRLFPINSEDDVAQSFAILKDNPYKDYSKADILYLLDRVCRAAEKFDVNLDDLLESLGGEIMSTVDTNSPEFTDAVKTATDKIMADFADKDTRAKAFNDLNEKLTGTESTISKLEKSLETVEAEKTKVEEAFKDYKKEVETKAKVRERIDALKTIGMKKKDWTETEDAVADMSDKVFALYKNQVTETIKAAENPFKKLTPEEQKKKDEEDKKKKAKGSTDIVEESKEEGTLPNTNDKSGDKDPFPNLTKAFDRNRKSGR